jgi:hypothetical protein
MQLRGLAIGVKGIVRPRMESAEEGERSECGFKTGR